MKAIIEISEKNLEDFKRCVSVKSIVPIDNLSNGEVLDLIFPKSERVGTILMQGDNVLARMNYNWTKLKYIETN